MLATHVSVPVAEDITVINKVSQNLHAELLLRLLGKVHGTDGSFAQGTRVVRQFLVDAGVDDGDFFFYDGSGMSPDDRIAPRAFTQLLAYASRQPWGAAWRETLPVAGVDGTLRPLQELAAQGPSVGQDRHAQRGKRALRLPDRSQRQDPGVLHPGQRPPPRQRRRTAGHRPHRRSHRRRGVNAVSSEPDAHSFSRWFSWHFFASAVGLASALAGCRSLPPPSPRPMWTAEEARGAQVYQLRSAPAATTPPPRIR